MKYQITCAHCDTRFLVDGKGGQTIECKCPGCGGTMRVTLPKVDKANEDVPADDYQTGYAPPTDNGSDNGGDNGDNRKRRRGLAVGCLLFVVIIAAAIVAFMALNHTTKKPIEDPYEYAEPDTTSIDTVEEDTVPETVDTVEVHEEKPKAKAEPVDTAVESNSEATDESEATTPDDESSAETGDKSSTKPASTSKDKSSKDKSSKDKSSKDKSSKDNTTKE